ncbi:MAG: CARDB domain-containing protein, partial [Armatimonadota bacterium]
VIDVSNLQIVNSVATAGNNPWFPMALVGNALYLGDFESGRTQIFDITNPTSPNSVGTIEGMLAGFDASSNRIVTNLFGTDFVVWDITNRTAPNRLARYSGLSPSVTALKDEYLITTTRTGLVVFNASNPAQLQKVSQIALPDLPIHYGIKLVLAGDLAVVSHSNYTAGPKIYFVNFENPTTPQLLGTDNLGLTTSVFDIAVIKDRYLLVGHSGGCEIIDLATRTRVGSVGGIYGSVLVVAGQGDVVCLVQSLGQGSILKVFDATDPLNMSFLREISLNEKVSDIEMVGSLVFIATSKANLLVVDVSDPSNPQQVASWTNPNAPQYDTQVRITVSGNFVYLSVSQYENGLIVLDLSNLPNMINKVASFTGRSCQHASVRGNLIYLAADDGLYVLRNLLVPQVLPPVIFSVSPRISPAASDVTLRVEGTNFASGAQVWLERANQRLNSNRVTIVGGNIIYAQFNLSNATLGKWDLVVRNPDGNLARKSEAVTIAEPSDLTLANLRLEPSANLQDGTPVTIKVTARNIGGMNANFVVRFLAGDKVIGNEPVSLAANTEAEVSLPWRVIGGNYQLRVIADPENAFPESNETNNEITLPINLPLPDLTVTSLNISPSSNLVDGQQVDVQVTVTNQGGGTSRPIAVKFLVDEGSYGEWTLYEGLGANRSQNLTFKHTVSAGQKKISVVLDPANTVPESDETNNRRDLVLPEIPPPDVAITNLRTYPSTNLSPGMNIQLIATVHNFGGQTMRGFTVSFSAAGSNLREWVNGIGANESKEVEVTWRNIPAGQHQIFATVEPYNSLPDTNLANNYATTVVEVTAPDFVLEGMEIRPSRAVSGATVTVVAFVQISGSGRTIFPIPVRLFDNDVPVGQAWIEAGIPAG